MTMEAMVRTLKEDPGFDSMEQLAYDLLFSSQRVFNIDFQQYCTFQRRQVFRDDIRSIIKRGGLKVLDDRIIHLSEAVMWKLELDK